MKSHTISPDTVIGKLTSTYATLMKEMHKCLPKTYTPVANLFLDVDQMLLDKSECAYFKGMRVFNRYQRQFGADSWPFQ
jgi:hypothetical protein